ncbi:uncharacterized protein DUF397 [Actinocorallia herbida]|uniref:Uncharacterized protein DUF397 n=1 Tax=Actinocorallia herbida TaxID=58109 RepID=A0A3N1CT88_9ACTN|nr:DUF397 domain-containing protein [Actinocorallia herbida]ROO84529.1 uncharacterized protein DUF397 [Actinocorallia herbida]
MTVWRKSSYSGINEECVELADLGLARGVRDSKNPGVGHQTLRANAFQALLEGIKSA